MKNVYQCTLLTFTLTQKKNRIYRGYNFVKMLVRSLCTHDTRSHTFSRDDTRIIIVLVSEDLSLKTYVTQLLSAVTET